MNVIIEGFEDDIKQRLEELMQEALSKGLEEVMFWAKLMSIKAEISIEGSNIIIRKEG